jgi:glycosyltransferase involved in cell wall biosynthesis
MKESQPLVSFILTYYNLPVQMLYECIDSILALSLSANEREIIVVDDGSEVSPMNGLMHYSDEIIYVRQKNQGLSMARNKGIEMARGKYLQFVDADDHLIEASYEHCLDIIRKRRDIEMVMFDFTTHATESQSNFVEQPLQSGTEYMLRHNIHGTAWGYLFKRTTLSELRFTPGIWHEDEEFTPQLLIRAEQICVTNAVAYFHYIRPNSITTASDEKSIDKRLHDRMGVLLRLNNLYDHLPQSERMALQRRVAQLTMDYIYQVIIQKRSANALEEAIEQLRSKGFFPLPNKDYTQKYVWFRRMTNTRLARTVLLNILPLMKKR